MRAQRAGAMQCEGRDCLEPVRRRVNPSSGIGWHLAESRPAAYSRAMSFEAIQQEITTWDAGNLRKLQALVVSLRLRQDEPDFAEKMARKIDDRTPGNWVTLEEFGQRLGLPPDAPA